MFLALVLFSGCYEMTEDIVINENGTGTYTAKMDMSALLQMVQSMAGEDEMVKKGLDRAIDTVMYLNKVMDSAKDATEEQRRLFKDGKLNLKLNMAENVFKTDINFPFQNLGDLQKLLSGAGTAGLAQAFKGAFMKDSAMGAAAASPMNNEGMDQINQIYAIKVTKNEFSRHLDTVRFKALMARPEMQQIEQVKSMGMELLYTTTLKFPRPVKKSDNPLVKLSEDKKTATIKYDLIKLLDDPSKYSYSISY